MKRWIAIGVLTVALLASLVLAALLWFNAGAARTEARHFQAQADFFASLATRDCLTITAVEDAAEKRGWVSERSPDNAAFIPQDASYTEADVAEALIIRIVPARPFSKGFGTFFHFDDQGCLLR